MLVSSSYFGEIDIDDAKIIKFENAIPGFENIHKYFVITEEAEDDSDEEQIFCWLHAIEDHDVAFAIIDVFKVKADYTPEIEEEDLEDLNYKDGDSLAVYNIVNIPENLDDMTVNLMAPIVINLSEMLGKQAILTNEQYTLKHRIYDEIKSKSSKQLKEEVE